MANILLRVEKELHLKLKEEAKSNRQSLNNYILSILDKRCHNMTEKGNIEPISNELQKPKRSLEMETAFIM